jgi:predicted lipoprotein with Yx(FWY)xxD motif
MGSQGRRRAAKIAGAIAGVAGTALLVAACGSSASSKSAASSSLAAHSKYSSKGPKMGSHSAHSHLAHGHPAHAPGMARPKTSGTATLKAQHTALGTVLANSKGATLYWFSKDTDMNSACTGACAATWIPVTGTPRPAAGMSMPGMFGTITRSGGVRQATYDGHPLYTLKSATAPGQVKGNDAISYGGRFMAIPVPVAPTGPAAPAAPAAPAGPAGPAKTGAPGMSPTPGMSATPAPSSSHSGY